MQRGDTDPTASSTPERPGRRRISRRAVRDARDRAIAWLLARRQADSTWADHTDPGVFPGAIYGIMLRTTGLIVSPGAHEDELGIVRHLVDRANDDGSFPRYSGGPPCRQVTRCAALALKLALGDVAPDTRSPEWFAANPLLEPELAERCRATLDRSERLLRSRAARGACSPGWDYWVLIALLSSHVLGYPRLPAWPLLLVAVAVRRVVRGGPTRATDSLSLPLRRAVLPMALIWDHTLRRRDRGRWLDVEATARRIAERQGANGGWFYVTVITALSTMALRVAGVPVTDPRIVSAWRFLRGLVRTTDSGGAFVGTAASDTWCTAWAARTYLARADHRADDARIRSVLRLVLASQNPDGGFAYARGSGGESDTDTTALVLHLLAEARDTSAGAVRPEVERATRAATAYLRALQNRNGGFGAWGRTFVRGGRGTFPVLHQYLFDAPSADLTARVLGALVEAGLGIEDEPVRRALSFLLRARCANGAWWSRWWAGYLAGTADVLSACGRLGLTPWTSRPPASRVEAHWRRALARGVRFILAHQNADGGWGETVGADHDRRAAGVGPSNPAHTAQVLSGLLQCGCPSAHPAVLRAVRYLLASAGRDGCWHYGDAAFTTFARSTYYAMPQFACWLPVQALTTYLNASERAEDADRLVARPQRGTPPADRELAEQAEA